MEQEILNKITETTMGYAVKNLTYKKRDNIITGQVKDPFNLYPNLHEGFVGCSWSIYGKPINANKGRTELILKM